MIILTHQVNHSKVHNENIESDSLDTPEASTGQKNQVLV